MRQCMLSMLICILMFIGTCEVVSGYTFEVEISRTLTKQSSISMKVEFVYEPTNELERKPLFWEINGKTYESVEYEILASRFSVASPIVCMSVQDGTDVHVLCGTFYWGCCPLLDRFSGLYRHEYPCTSEGETTTCVEEEPVDLLDYDSEHR